MKKIVLHAPALDNAGAYCDAGTELEVGDKAEAGMIDADRARALVDAHSAVSQTASEQIERSAKPAFDPAPFTVSSKPGGRYEIAGPGLAAPEPIKGKAVMQARVAELRAALRAALPPAQPDQAEADQ